ncbi:homoserine kinase [Thiolinea disciformis]|uniref:homoserine kinase n=1 Tax=Thiolinea disciformis TaxID=125614 RepID=UPI0003615A83|nr:homoserine kinase [Thiolinea disciformis]
MSVHTPISFAELSRFLRSYELGDLLEFEGITAGVENSNFFVTTTRGKYVLTLLEQYDLDQASYFFALMDWMAQAGIPSAMPLRDRQHSLRHSLNGKPAVLVERLAGHILTHANVEQCAIIGQVLAQIHLAGKDFPHYRAPDRGHVWRQQTTNHLLPLLDKHDSALLRQEMAFQQQVPLDQLPQGVIHADLFCDNVLFDQQQLTGVIDWYYACHDPWLYDVAIVVNDWCCDSSGALDPERLTICLQTYHQLRPFTPAEAEQFWGLVRAAALRFWLSRLVAWHLPQQHMQQIILRKDPEEFRQKLQLRQQDESLLHQCWPKSL